MERGRALAGSGYRRAGTLGLPAIAPELYRRARPVTRPSRGLLDLLVRSAAEVARALAAGERLAGA